MKTLQELHELGIKKLNFKSSITRKLISPFELDEILKDKEFVHLFILMNFKKVQIINCLNFKRPFYFLGEEIDISKFDFLINKKS